MEAGHRATELLSLQVRLRGIGLGMPADILLDASAERVLGLDVRCGDEAHRFLPLAACDVLEDHLAIDSALLLSSELAFYRQRGRSLASLRGSPVRCGVEEVGLLVDLIFDDDGRVRKLVVESGRGRRELAREDAVVLEADAVRPAV